MKVVVQLLSNNILQKVPSILLTVKNQQYIWNLPQNYLRYVSQYHMASIRPPLSVFFTKNKIQAIGGLLNFMEEGSNTRFFSKNCRFYAQTVLYEYMRELRYKLGSSMIPYSYFNFETGGHQLGFNSEKHTAILHESKHYTKVIDQLSNQYIESHIQKEKQNNSLQYIRQEEGKFYFKDKYLECRPIAIGQTINYFINISIIVEKVHNDIVQKYSLEQDIINEIRTTSSYQLESGQVLKRSQLFYEQKHFQTIIILHYQTKQNVQEILNNKNFNEQFDKLKGKQSAGNLVIHIDESEGDIVKSEQFKQLLKKFQEKSKDYDKKFQHLIHNSKYQNRGEHKQVYPCHFPIVSSINEKWPQLMPNLIKIKQQQKLQKLVLQEVHKNSQLFASRQCYQMMMFPLKNYGYHMINDNRLTSKNKFEFPIDKMNDKIKKFREIPASKSQYPNIVFLGTSAAKSERFRNVSCIFLQFSQSNSMIMDCGEGSYFQLVNHFGINKIQEIIMSIKVIFITHMHIDHNLGILQLIKERTKAFKKRGQKVQKVFLIIPNNMIQWFQSFNLMIQDLSEGCDVLFIQTISGEKIFINKDSKNVFGKTKKNTSNNCPVNKKQYQNNLQNDYQFLHPHLTVTLQKYSNLQKDIYERFLSYTEAMNISKFSLIPVQHCPQSYAIVLEQNGRKISYSGDCRPSQDFAKQAKKSALLIHEATFNDNQRQNALNSFHSTVSEALDIALISESQMTALTHFSSRMYRKENHQRIFHHKYRNTDKRKYQYSLMNTFLAFDHLQVKLQDMKMMPYACRKIDQLY